jgi:hypothetical protein
LIAVGGVILASALKQDKPAHTRASVPASIITTPAPASRASAPAATSPVSAPGGAAAEAPLASYFAVSTQYNCLTNLDVVPFLQANHANVLRLILSPQRARAAEGVGCVKNANAAGFKVYVSFQFANNWSPGQVAAYFRQVLPAYAPFLWAVGVGNEQDLRSPDAKAQGTEPLGSRGRTTGENYRADWDAVEPVLATLVPDAIRVYGEFSPWGFDAIKKGFASSRPAGVQAIGEHCYHTKRPGGLLQVPKNAAWAASVGLPLWCSEMGPAIQTSATPDWVVPDTWASWNATLATIKSNSPNLQLISYYYWPAL